MAIEKIDIETFLKLAEKYPVLDVRSPAEFDHAHIPAANSFPLFSDEERKVVGTAYKQQSREVAIKIGLVYFGIKMRRMVEDAEKLHFDGYHLPANKKASGQPLPVNPKTVLIHCWRGGMRSAAVAWLLGMYGFKVYTLNGGYKSFRQYVLKTFTRPLRFNMIAGYTGTGKTKILQELAKYGENIIDLEGLANHKGSAFGGIGQPPQPSQEMFENLLAMELCKKGRHAAGYPIHPDSGEISDSQPTKTHIVWLEDESQRIGTVNIPPEMWNRMRRSKVYFFDIPAEARLDHLIEEYGGLDKEKVAHAILRIGKRLGGQETKTAIRHLLEDNVRDCFNILLKYYDKCYLKGLQCREDLDECMTTLSMESVDEEELGRALISLINITSGMQLSKSIHGQYPD